jgi:hypothetical protein
MPRSALPRATPTPDRQTRIPTTSEQESQDAWKRRALLIFLLILATGIVPIVLTGEVRGWWVLSHSPPFIVPR